MKVTFFSFMFLLCIAIPGCKNRSSVGGSPLKSDSYLSVTSQPSGALVEIAVEIEGNNNFKPGSGRSIGATPCQTTLQESDITEKGMINYIMQYGGQTTIGQLKIDKPMIPGHTYTIHQVYKR